MIYVSVANLLLAYVCRPALLLYAFVLLYTLITHFSTAINNV